MQSLLRWSLEHSGPQSSAASNERRPPPDPAIIDAILGRPDAELMKEDVAVAIDTTRPEDERINALDHLEMLIEQIDNANNLANLGLWDPLHKLLISQESSPDLMMQVLWVLGTAMQNNPSAQDAYLALNPLQILTSFLIPSPSSTVQTRSKAIYALSGLLKHNAPAVRGLGNPNVDGWPRFRNSLQDPEITVRRKTIFLLANLLLPATSEPTSSSSHPGMHVPSASLPDQPSEPVHDNSHAVHIKDPSRMNTAELTLEAFREHGFPGAVISALTNPLPYGEDGDIQEPDETFEEQSIRLLYNYVVLSRGQLSETEKETLRNFVEEAKKREGEKRLAERWNLALQEFEEITARLRSL